jgi:hypothetical protein
MVSVPAGVPEPSVFGFAVQSTIAWQFLRNGGGTDPLDIVEGEEHGGPEPGDLLGDWPLAGTPYPAHARLLRIPRGYEYMTSDAGRFRIDLENARIEVPATGDPLLREQRLYGLPMILSLVSRGDVSLHAAATQVGSGAVLLAAPSRYGKSTLALAFQRRGYRVLCEDLVCCRPHTLEAIPGPALIRIRPDVFSPDLPDGLFVAGARPDRVFVGFDAAHRGSSDPLPIRGVVFLRNSDGFKVETVPRATALKDLWSLNFRTGTEADRVNSFQKLAALAGSVDSWNLYRPFRLSALDETVDLVLETIGG